jgi:hypothetical protein
MVSPSADTVARLFTLPPSCCPPPLEPDRTARSPKPHLDPVHPHVDPIDQQLHDPRLLGGEELSHSESSCSSASRASSSVMSSCSARAARQVPTMISGCRKMPRNWLTTAASISAAGTRPTGQASGPAPGLSQAPAPPESKDSYLEIGVAPVSVRMILPSLSMCTAITASRVPSGKSMTLCSTRMSPFS